MGGGPSAAQNEAASAQAGLSREAAATGREMLGFWKDQYNKINPYGTERLNNGLPFMPAMMDQNTGAVARSFAPQKQALNQRLSAFGTLPSGFAEQARTDLAAQQARAYDSQLMGDYLTNEQSKAQAAGVLTGQQAGANPLGWTGQAMSGNQSVMQAPLASPGVGGLISGLAGGAMAATGF